MSEQATIRRRSRYRAGGAAGLRLTARDIEIVRLVARYRFLGRDQIGQLLALGGFAAGGMLKRNGEVVFDPARLVHDRLTQLFHAELLTRPRAKFELDFPGSKKMTYALGREGVGLLRGIDGEKAVGIEWARKSASGARRFIDHTLGINEFEIALRQAAAKRNDLTVTVGDDLVPEAVRAELKLPWRYSVDVMVGNEKAENVGVVPDLAVMVGKGEQRLAYLVEICRGNEPVVRYQRDRSGRRKKKDADRKATLEGTSILRKLLSYSVLKRSDSVGRRLGWKQFKVLFLCEGRERGERRVALMRKAVAQRVPDNRGMFLFADREALVAHDDVLSFDWMNWEGLPQRIDPVWVAVQLQKKR